MCCEKRDWQGLQNVWCGQIGSLVLLLVLLSAHGAAAAAAAAAKAAAADAAAVADRYDAAAAASPAAPEFTFWDKHVASKCFAPPDATWALDDAAKETVLHRQTQFFGVYEQPEGFYYHYSTTTKQTEYNIVNGTRVRAAKPQRHSSVYRCQYGVRRSTKAVYGICYPSDATGVPLVETPVPWPFTVYTTTLKLLDPQTLQQTLSTLPPYEDLLAATPSGVKPGRQETVVTYTLGGNGKATMSTKISAYDVDPITMERRFVGTQEPGIEQQVPCS